MGGEREELTRDDPVRGLLVNIAPVNDSAWGRDRRPRPIKVKWGVGSNGLEPFRDAVDGLA